MDLNWEKPYEDEVIFASSRGVCQNCGHQIRIQIFKGEDWCSEDCRKALQGEA